LQFPLRQQVNFLNLIKQGIGEAIKIGAAPFEDVKTLDFNVGNDNNFRKLHKSYGGYVWSKLRPLFIEI